MDCTPEPPGLSVAVNITVTFELFQPAAFADGVPLATVVGAILSQTTAVTAAVLRRTETSLLFSFAETISSLPS
jgi:hypothetical protein